MKSLIFFILIICSGMNGIAQNRIHGWDLNAISSIQVEFVSQNDETEIHKFNLQTDMDTILAFLKEVDFKELEGNGIDTEIKQDSCTCKLVFQGQRDQVYLHKYSASIGKTTFLIDENVFSDFNRLVNSLLVK